MRSIIATVSAFLFVLPLSGAELTTLKGKKHTGEIVSIDAVSVVIKTATGDVPTPLAEILQLTLPAPSAVKTPEKFSDIELIDGTSLHCTAFTIKGKTVEVDVLGGLKVSLPTSAVAWILIEAHDPGVRKDWDGIVGERTKADRFFVRQGERLDGLEGTLGDASADGKSIDFTDMQGRPRKLPVDRLVALLFNNRLEGNIAPTACRVTDAARNTLVAQKAILKGTSLSVTTVAGVTFEYSTLQTVAVLDYSKDKIVYLSDLKPSAEEKPFDELVVLYSKDANLDNQPITLEGVSYSKGLVLHPPLVLSYDIGGEYKEFKAMVGVENGVQTPSHVRLIIEGDGRKLYEAEVKLKDKPRPVTLDVKKIRQIKVRVIPEGLPFGHQVTLADARVTK